MLVLKYFQRIIILNSLLLILVTTGLDWWITKHTTHDSELAKVQDDVTHDRFSNQKHF